MDIEDLSGKQIDSFLEEFKIPVEDDNKLRAIKDFLYKPYTLKKSLPVIKWFERNSIDFKNFTW